MRICCKLLFVIFLCCVWKECNTLEGQILRSCISAKTCENCLQAGPSCAWCSDSVNVSRCFFDWISEVISFRHEIRVVRFKFSLLRILSVLFEFNNWKAAMQLTGKIEAIRLPTAGNSYEFCRDDRVYQGLEFSGYGTGANTDTIAAATNKSDDSTSFRDNNTHSLSAGQVRSFNR